MCYRKKFLKFISNINLGRSTRIIYSVLVPVSLNRLYSLFVRQLYKYIYLNLSISVAALFTFLVTSWSKGDSFKRLDAFFQIFIRSIDFMQTVAKIIFLTWFIVVIHSNVRWIFLRRHNTFVVLQSFLNNCLKYLWKNTLIF